MRARVLAALSAVLAACGGGSTSDPDADRDKDGLSDRREMELGTKPDAPDSDGDGVWDGEEVSIRKTDPKTPNPEFLANRPTTDNPVDDGSPRYMLPPSGKLPANWKCANKDAVSSCFVHVPGGTFAMGAQAADPAAPGYDPAARPEEGPVHPVTVGPFWIMKYEAQAGQFEMCVKDHICREDDVARGGFHTYQQPDKGLHPITGVTWNGAVRFCSWLGARLPTEAEWELAARGLEGARYPWGSVPQCGVSPPVEALGPNFRDRDDQPDAACENDGTAPTGRLRGPSPFGLLGMSGNVWEWVADAYGPFPALAQTDPKGPATGEHRVQRGGGWTSIDPVDLRAAVRGSLPPDQKLHDVGFRCARDVRGDAP